MEQELREHISVIERNQKTIQNEVVATRNKVLRTYADLDQAFTRLFQRLNDLEAQSKVLSDALIPPAIQ
jgi:hypothetical protein